MKSATINRLVKKSLLALVAIFVILLLLYELFFFQFLSIITQPN